MDHIRKLPFITGGFTAVLTGAASYAAGADNKSTYIRMAVVMVLFYIIGVYIKNTILAINTEKEEKEELERLRELEETAAAEQQAAKQNTGTGHKLDLVAGGSDDEFTPLAVSQVISTKLKE